MNEGQLLSTIYFMPSICDSSLGMSFRTNILHLQVTIQQEFSLRRPRPTVVRGYDAPLHKFIMKVLFRDSNVRC